MKGKIFNSQKSFVFTATAFIAAFITTGWGVTSFSMADTTGKAAAPVIESNTSKAILGVRGMTCGGCIKNVKKSLAGFDGVSEVNVDMKEKRAEIFFDNKKIADAKKIAAAITAAGYPSQVIEVVQVASIETKAGPVKAAKDTPGPRVETKTGPVKTAKDAPGPRVEKKSEPVKADSSKYLASIGGWNISRDEFNTEMEIVKTRYKKKNGEDSFNSENGKKVFSHLKKEVFNRLIAEGIRMREIEDSGFKIDESAIEDEIGKVLAREGMDRKAFISKIAKDGYTFDYYKKKFGRNVLLVKYLEKNIFKDAKNDGEKQKIYRAWYNNLKSVATVDYYDRDLKKLVGHIGARREH